MGWIKNDKAFYSFNTIFLNYLDLILTRKNGPHLMRYRRVLKAWHLYTRQLRYGMGKGRRNKVLRLYRLGVFSSMLWLFLDMERLRQGEATDFLSAIL